MIFSKKAEGKILSLKYLIKIFIMIAIAVVLFLVFNKILQNAMG